VPVEIKSIVGEFVVVTGVVVGMTRDEVAAAIGAAGGKPGDSVTAKTTLLVVGDKPGATKLNRADVLHIPTITEAEFRQLLEA
jgi:DNA ligase (NAD+)